VPGWNEESLKQLAPAKGIVYYTDNRLDESIAETCRRQILNAKNGHELVSVSLLPIEFGKNITLDMERGYLTMFREILAGLEASTADVVFFCEHDCLYPPSHFEFIPPRRDVYYYNTNVWKVDALTGHALHCDDTRQTSGLCAYRDLLLRHYRERVRRVEAEGFHRKIGFEPGTHNRKERIDDYKSDTWTSAVPILDIRHDKNLTPSRWHKEQFRDQRYTKGWTEQEYVEGWYKPGEFERLLCQRTSRP
jgi:hypothetical protein